MATNQKSLGTILGQMWIKGVGYCEKFEFGRSLNQFYQCKIPEFKIEKDTPLEEIMTNYASLALDTTFEIFERFNWDKVSQGTKDALKTDQDKILLKA